MHYLSKKKILYIFLERSLPEMWRTARMRSAMDLRLISSCWLGVAGGVGGPWLLWEEQSLESPSLMPVGEPCMPLNIMA